MHIIDRSQFPYPLQPQRQAPPSSQYVDGLAIHSTLRWKSLRREAYNISYKFIQYGNLHKLLRASVRVPSLAFPIYSHAGKVMAQPSLGALADQHLVYLYGHNMVN